jgi:hypothetical protein
VFFKAKIMNIMKKIWKTFSYFVGRGRVRMFTFHYFSYIFKGGGGGGLASAVSALE